MTWHVIRVHSKDAQKQLARTSLIEESYNSREIMLSGSTIDTFEARAERVTLNPAISVVSNLLGKDLFMLLISRQTALSLFTYTHIKFLSFLTQRLSFCSTNVVKVQVSSILKGKKISM